MTYSHGRPAYMAVFGQIPRIGAGLLQDDTAPERMAFRRFVKHAFGP